MWTSWRWGEPAAGWRHSVVVTELSLRSLKRLHVETVICGLCSGWICGTPATWSSGTSSWEVYAFLSGSWVRQESTTRGEKNVTHTSHHLIGSFWVCFMFFIPLNKSSAVPMLGSGWFDFIITDMNMCCSSNSRAVTTSAFMADFFKNLNWEWMMTQKSLFLYFASGNFVSFYHYLNKNFD